jgi:hypothetical protein
MRAQDWNKIRVFSVSGLWLFAVACNGETPGDQNAGGQDAGGQDAGGQDAGGQSAGGDDGGQNTGGDPQAGGQNAGGEGQGGVAQGGAPGVPATQERACELFCETGDEIAADLGCLPGRDCMVYCLNHLVTAGCDAEIIALLFCGSQATVMNCECQPEGGAICSGICEDEADAALECIDAQ